MSFVHCYRYIIIMPLDLVLRFQYSTQQKLDDACPDASGRPSI